jgi:hypothetical protein
MMMALLLALAVVSAGDLHAGTTKGHATAFESSLTYDAALIRYKLCIERRRHFHGCMLCRRPGQPPVPHLYLVHPDKRS